MKRLTIAVLTMGAIISAVGPAAAQGIYLDLGGPGPRYRDYDEPRYYRRDYDEPRYRGNVGIIGPAGLEPGTGASKDGPCKTVAVNRTGAIKRVSNI
jgi:hypothetical protein